MPKKSSGVSRSAAHWLNAARLRAYCLAILLTSLICLLRAAWQCWQMYSVPSGLDFTTFWAASRLWLDGTPLEAYSIQSLVHAAQQISPTLPPPGPFFYPPNFLLLLRPLALLPCPVASPIFALTAACVFVLLLRRVLPMRDALLPILAFPGMWLTMLLGQNSCVTASLALGAFMLLKKRPILAGLCIGLLSIKPHLGILFPLALACAGMWTTFIAAGVTTVLLTGISVAVFGVASIPTFLHAMSLANTGMAIGMMSWQQTASLFGTLRAAHVPAAPAYVAQACQAIAAIAVAAWVWRQSDDLAVRAMALVAATFMTSPYIFNYDAAWLAAPIALFTVKALRDGWLRWEREILCVAWLYPGLGSLSGYLLHAGIGPLVFASLLFVAVRRTRLERGVTPTAASTQAEPQALG